MSEHHGLKTSVSFARNLAKTTGRSALSGLAIALPVLCNQ